MPLEVQTKEEVRDAVLRAATKPELEEAKDAFIKWVEDHPDDKLWLMPVGSTLGRKSKLMGVKF